MPRIKFDEEQEVSTEEPEFDYQYFVSDLTVLVRYYIDSFFRDKRLYCGGPIPKKLLHTTRYINLTLNSDVTNQMEMIYNILNMRHSKEELHNIEREGRIPDDVKYVISLLNQCSSAGVPQQFSIGIIIMHLELCEGRKLVAA